jgi:hypothetical protein
MASEDKRKNKVMFVSDQQETKYVQLIFKKHVTKLILTIFFNDENFK